MEFRPEQWIAILQNDPVILILLGGTIGGIALTQTVKLIWFTLGIDIGVKWYRLAVVLHVTLTTYVITSGLWVSFNLTSGTGLRHVVSLISAVAAPYTYKGVKALVAARWPNFAAKWGDSHDD